MNRVNVGGVHDQQRCGVELVEELGICAAETLEVILVEKLLVRNTPARDASAEHARRCLQIDYEIGLGRIELQAFIYLLVKTELVCVEIELGEQSILIENEIGHSNRSEQICLANLLDLPRALE